MPPWPQQPRELESTLPSNSIHSDPSPLIRHRQRPKCQHGPTHPRPLQSAVLIQNEMPVTSSIAVCNGAAGEKPQNRGTFTVGASLVQVRIEFLTTHHFPYTVMQCSQVTQCSQGSSSSCEGNIPTLFEDWDSFLPGSQKQR